jgi:hypothetical protein
MKYSVSDKSVLVRGCYVREGTRNKTVSVILFCNTLLTLAFHMQLRYSILYLFLENKISIILIEVAY